MFTMKTKIVTSLAIFAAFIIVSCSNEESDVSEKDVARPVKLITSKQADVVQTRRYPAEIEAALSRQLSFNVSGLLSDLFVKESQKISKGDSIAQLELKNFQSKVDATKSKFDAAEKEYQRGMRLQQGDAISRSELEKRQSQRDIAKAELDTAKKALDDTTLIAPFSGVVAKVPVKKLQNVQAGEEIVTIFEENRLQATINLPANVVATALKREKDEAFIILEAAPEERISAIFHEAKLEADTVTQTFAITFTFEPPKNLVTLPGMNAIVEIVSSQNQIEDSKRGVTVPLGAILSDGNTQYVWVVDNDTMTVSRRQVTVTEGVGETVIVTEGLKPGEIFAGAGAAYLTEGMKVRQWSMQ